MTRSEGNVLAHSGAMLVTRRNFLAGVTAAAGAAALSPRRVFAQTSALPDPGQSRIDHIVVLMMENRSFDHFFGWLPGADGRQAGLTYSDRAGQPHSTYPLAPDYQGCTHPDPDHSYEGGRVEYDGGKCDGWLRAGANDDYSIGYYTQRDLRFFGRMVPQWTTFDRYFAPIMAETYPNRIYQHAAQTDRIHNDVRLCTLPTIWDRLAEHGVEGRYYYSDVPFLALWGPKYIPISRPVNQFFIDCATGNLPAVSFVDPRFVDEQSGTSSDDHPHADIRNGEVFIDWVYKAVTLTRDWPNTLLVINYDEWGGFFDHVAPDYAPIPPADQAAGSDGLRGFRVPTMLVSPHARRGSVSSTLYDHNSVLKLIEWRYNLEPLTVRDTNANNLADALDFSSTSLAAPQTFVPPGTGVACPAGSAPIDPAFLTLRDLARSYGWPV